MCRFSFVLHGENDLPKTDLEGNGNEMDPGGRRSGKESSVFCS